MGCSGGLPLHGDGESGCESENHECLESITPSARNMTSAGATKRRRTNLPKVNWKEDEDLRRSVYVACVGINPFQKSHGQRMNNWKVVTDMVNAARRSKGEEQVSERAIYQHVNEVIKIRRSEIAAEQRTSGHSGMPSIFPDDEGQLIERLSELKTARQEPALPAFESLEIRRELCREVQDASLQNMRTQRRLQLSPLLNLGDSSSRPNDEASVDSRTSSTLSPPNRGRKATLEAILKQMLKEQEDAERHTTVLMTMAENLLGVKKCLLNIKKMIRKRRRRQETELLSRRVVK